MFADGFEGLGYLLGSVHQLQDSQINTRREIERTTYEKPHAGAETSRKESVERADGVDVDGVAAVGTV